MTTMTYAPILSDTEFEVLIASLNLTMRNVGMKIAQEGPSESFVGQLNAVQQLKSKLEASEAGIELAPIKAEAASE